MLDRGKHQQRYEFLTEDKIEEGALLLAHAFLTMNKVWITLQVPREDAEAVMLARVNKAYKNQLSVVPMWKFR